MNNLLALTMLGLTALPTAALAQTAEAPKATTEVTAAPVATDAAAAPVGLQFVTTQPADSLFSSDLVGYSVYGSGDEKIGDINDILISGDGNVEAVVIGVGGFIGIGEKDVAVPIGSLEIELVDDRFTISIDATEETLTDAPEFARADGTSSDRLGAFERTFTRARNDAGKAIDAVSVQAEKLYDKASGAASDAAETAGELAEEAGDKVEEAGDKAKAAVN